MRLDAMSCLSPTSARVDAPFAPARPEDLCYGFTLPAGPRSPGVARAVSRTILGAGGRERCVDRRGGRRQAGHGVEAHGNSLGSWGCSSRKKKPPTLT